MKFDCSIKQCPHLVNNFLLDFQQILSQFLFRSKYSMSQSKHSKSRTRVLLQNVPSTDILHKGFQRKISHSEYVKAFPKMRLRLNCKHIPMNISKNQCNQEYIYGQVQNMKVQNRKLEDDNQQLITKIRKESKLNQIFLKKMDNQSIQYIPFERVFEIKLLLQLEELQEKLKNKQQQHNKLIGLTKKKRQSIQQHKLDPFIDLYILLKPSAALIQTKKRSKEMKLEQIYFKLSDLSQKRQKLKNNHRLRLAQLNNIKIHTQKESIVLSSRPEIIHENNQSSVQCGMNRTRNIEDLQAELQKIREETNIYQIKVQQEIDSKIKQKLKVIREIQKISDKLQNLDYLGRKENEQIIQW